MAVNSNGKRPREMPVDHPKIKLCIRAQCQRESGIQLENFYRDSAEKFVEDMAAALNVDLENQQDGDEVYYRVRRDCKIQSLLMAYCKEKNLEYEVMRFVYDEKRLDIKKSPDEIGMEDEDCIDAFTDGSGGGYLATTLW